MKEIKELTKAELQIMQIIWEKGEVFVNDIIAEMPSPKPVYTTVSTIVRILVEKNFLAYKAFGKTHQYYQVISKEEYTQKYMTGVVNNFFSGSFKSLVSFFAEKENLSIGEIDDIIDILNHNKKNE